MTSASPTSVADRSNGQTPVESVLSLENVTAGYGRTTVLRDVTLHVPKGQVVALLGPNGAGKTTLLRVASGLLAATSGIVRLSGSDVSDRSPSQRAKAGLCLIPEGRGVYPSLTVRDNLRLHLPPWRRKGSLDPGLEAFPDLSRRLDQQAGSLSGGQQQMLALARTYLCDPAVVLLDEVSMGLAPIVVDEIFESLAKLAKTGMSLLLVEQYVNRAIELADQVVLLNKGSVAFSGSSSELDQSVLDRGYLGVDELDLVQE